MPKYKVKAPDGRTVILTGDSAPTEADLDEVFASLPQPKDAASDSPSISGILDSTNRIAQVGANSIPVIGKAYVPFMAAQDATADYLADKLGFSVPQKPDGTPTTWKERYDHAKSQYKQEIADTEAQHPWQSLGASVLASSGIPVGAATKAKTLGGAITNSIQAAVPLGAIDAGLRAEGSLPERVKASALGASVAVPAGAVFGTGGYALSKAGNKIIPAVSRTVIEPLKAALRGAKSTVGATKKGLERTKFVGGFLGRSPEEIAAGAQEISGMVPDNGEMAGTAVKNLADDLTRGVKDKATAMYDAFEQAAAGQKVVLDNKSNFMKVFNEIADNTTKSGRAELNSLYNEVGHTVYDAPTHKAMKSFVSKLGEKSATGGSALSKHEYGLLKAAAEKDMEASLGKEVLALKKAADAFYRDEMANPNSITNTADKLLRKDPTSVVGNRAISSAQGKAWKASSLKKLVDEGEKVGSPYVADVKQALQANTTTRAQFNRMSPAQKQMVYGDKLDAAEKNFNGGVLNRTEKVINNALDNMSEPLQRIIDVLRERQMNAKRMYVPDVIPGTKIIDNMLKALGY